MWRRRWRRRTRRTGERKRLSDRCPSLAYKALVLGGRATVGVPHPEHASCRVPIAFGTSRCHRRRRCRRRHRRRCRWSRGPRRQRRPSRSGYGGAIERADLEDRETASRSSRPVPWILVGLPQDTRGPATPLSRDR
jgi:hypothetical protein